MAKATTKSVTKETESKETKMSNENILELDMSLESFEDFEPLPASEYPAEVRSAEKRISDKGNEYYYVVFNIHPDDFPADYAVENAPEGMNLVFARLQVPTAANRRSITAIKNWYRALGLSLSTNVINPGEWEGKRAKLVVDKSEYNGETRNGIKSVEALD
jgi:signal recognition particle subunit SEC65